MTTDFSKEKPILNPSHNQNQRLSIKLKDELEAIKADPGEWYRLLTYNTLSAAYRARRALEDQCDGFEFTASQGTVHGRYLNGDAA